MRSPVYTPLIMFKFMLISALFLARTSLGMAAEMNTQDSLFDFIGFTLAYPPAKGSSVDLNDENTLRTFQATRTQAECNQAEAENKVDLNHLYGPETGVLTSEEVKMANSSAEEIITVVALVTGKFKLHFGRSRPYDDYSGLTPCITKPWDSTDGLKFSYPSSYASISTVLDAMLTQRFPGKAAAIHAQSAQLCKDRVLGGVHHPSDIEAGLQLGHQILERHWFKLND